MAILAAATSACNSHEDETKLFVTIHRGETRTVEMLLKSGVDVNCRQRSIKKETPLIFAAYLGNFEAVELILKYSPDLEAVDSQGMTALCHALTSPYYFREDPANVDKYVRIVNALVAKGAAKTNTLVLQVLAIMDKDDPRLILKSTR